MFIHTWHDELALHHALFVNLRDRHHRLVEHLSAKLVVIIRLTRRTASHVHTVHYSKIGRDSLRKQRRVEW